MRKNIKKVMAWLLLSGLVTTSSGVVAVASDNMITTNSFVTSKKDVAETILYLTADMVSEDGTIVVEEGEWNKLVIPNELQTKKITLKNVSVKELEMESGTDCVLEVKGGTIGNVFVSAPEIKTMGQKEINELLESGKTSTEVAELYRTYQKEKATLESLVPTIVTDKETKIDTVKISANVTLNLSKDNVGKIAVESVGNQSKLKVEIANYTGRVSVKQEKETKQGRNLLNITLKDSVITNLDMNSTGGSTCYIKEKGTSKVGTVEVTGNSKVNFNIPVEKVTVTKQAENAFVKLYNDAKEVVVEGTKTEIMVSASATVENAVVSGDNVKIYGQGKLNVADIAGKGANVSTAGTKVEGENDKTVPPNIQAQMPTTKPSRPTATPTQKPSVTPPMPTVPTDKPNDDTELSTPGALVTPKPEETVTPSPTTKPEGTVTPTPTTKPEENVKNEYDANGNVVKKIYYDIAGNVEKYEVFEYYANGQVKQRTRYNAKDIMTYYIKYNEEGKKTESFSTLYSGPDLQEITSYYKSEYDKNENVIKKIHYDVSGNVKYYEVLEYDANGNNIKTIQYDASGNQMICFTYEYYSNGKVKQETGYDEDNNIVSIRKCSEEGKTIEYISYDYYQGQLVSSYKTEYDFNGKAVKSVKHNSSGSIIGYCIYEYYDNGRRKQETEYNANNQKIDIFKWDENGNQIGYTGYQYDEVTGELEKYWETQWDGDGKEIKHTSYNADGQVTDYTEYSYYENGNKKQTIAYSLYATELCISWLTNYNENGNIVNDIFYFYDEEGNLTAHTEGEYDFNGNCVKGKTYDADNNLISYRIYEYYDNGKMKQETCYEIVNQKERLESISKYDENGVEREYVNYTYDSEGELKQYEVSQYDENRNYIKYICYNENNIVTRIREYKYHENGKQKQSIGYGIGERLEWIINYDENEKRIDAVFYSYDRKGNLTGYTKEEYENGDCVKWTQYDAEGNIVAVQEF